MPYAAFAKTEDIVEPRVETFCPKPGDPDDYVAIACANGKRYAITNSCAANVLGYAKPGMHAFGNPDAARLAIAPLAKQLGVSIEDAARRILTKASDKVLPVVDSLIKEYGLDRDQVVLVGEGGGAAALIPFVAERMKLDFKISQDAEVISSIGVALAMVRETIERVVPNPTPEELQAIKREAFDAAVRLGAALENVEVTIEVDAQTQRVRATAMGASEMRAQDLLKAIDEPEARAIAAKSMGVEPASLELAGETDQMRVFQATVEEKKWKLFKSRRKPVRAVDREGVIRVQRADAKVLRSDAANALAQLRRAWEDATIYNGDSVITPDVFVIAGRRVVDLSGIGGLEQATAVARSELEGMPGDAAVVLISVAGARGA